MYKNKSVINKLPLPKMLVLEDFISPGEVSQESLISGKQMISPINGRIDKVNLTIDSDVY